MIARIPSVFTTFRLNSSSVVHWLTMLRTFFLMTSPKGPSKNRGSIGTSYWSRNPTLDWATEDLGAWRHASSIRWLRWKFRPWVMASAINTVCSSKPSRTAGNTKFRTTGCVVLTLGRSRRQNETVEVPLNCSFKISGGSLRAVLGQPSSLIGVPFDRPMVGYGGKTINTLRLWEAAASDYFDFQEFSSGDFVGALAETLQAESLTRVLYPDDQTAKGQGLRFVQEHFLVASSLADLVRRFRKTNKDWRTLPDKVAIQLNDTHPTMAVPELMRILLDEAHLGWDEAWDLTQRTLAYTNHTLLPEALEKWPVVWFERMLPRHLEIIYEINRRLIDDVRRRFPKDEGRVQRVSLVEEGAERKIRMANLAIVGSHSTNGVAAIHSQLLRTMTVKDLAEMFPQRFSNKTNGVTPRRWLLMSNPALSQTITDAIGEGWVTDLSQLKKLKPLAGDQCVTSGFSKG